MDIEQFLLRLGIRTYSYPVYTEFNAPAIEVPIGDSLSTELGWIYGVSCDVEGVTSKDATKLLPTYAQSAGLYLNLVNGQTWYVNDMRMSNLVYNNPITALPINPRRYMPLNIPMQTDLKQSIIRNPLSLVGFTTMITFYYIPRATYNELTRTMGADGKPLLQQLDKGITS